MQATTPKPKLRKGVVTPLFYLPSTEGNQSGPAALRSKYNMVLAFVDDTPGSTAYLQALAAVYPAILEARSRVIAVLSAPLDRASDLVAKLNLPFPLLADAGGSATQRMIGGERHTALCIADRFGQVYYLEIAPSSEALPSAHAALEWLAYIQIQCPE